MHLKRLEISGFKSFAKKTVFSFESPVTAIVGPNGSGKSNVAESLRWVLGEQSMKSLRGKRGEDLIWNGSKTVPRSNRAAVTIVFDNTERTFQLDFDEVAVSREVHRDGTNEYSINDSKVRLRDIYELLSAVSLGASSHHIINQGEADRVLNTSTRERRTMIEDALGLKIFQYKKEESEKKLEKTQDNIKEAEGLRRELAPHLKFLKKQVEQVEKAVSMRDELAGLYLEYFGTEAGITAAEHTKIAPEKNRLTAELNRVNDSLGLAEQTLSSEDSTEAKGSAELRTIEQRLEEIRRNKDNLMRTLGRLEGKLEFKPAETFVEQTEQGERRCRYCKQVLREERAHDSTREFEQMLENVKKEKEETEKSLSALSTEEEKLRHLHTEVKNKLDQALSHSRQAERSLYDLKAERGALIAALDRIASATENIKVREEDFKRELGEAGILVGKHATNYTVATVSIDELPNLRALQDERRRKIERYKVRLEDMGGGGEEIMKEFEETKRRDEFLEREIADLNASAESLRHLMQELTRTLEEKFRDGMQKINKEFSEFFSILFGGGRASLAIVKEVRRKPTIEALLAEEGEVDSAQDEEETQEWGIGVDVDLPRKKIRGLEMLSGGERALTSIALLFAMSQVNPPPFLVLDETDAALDEANSRKYGDMIENLSKKSQLIVITHNRETMSRAQILYGVTMSSDSVSQLLSVKLDEAATYAK